MRGSASVRAACCLLFNSLGKEHLKGACSLLKVNLARRLIHVLKEHFTRSYKSIKSCYCRSLLLVRCKSQAPPPPLRAAVIALKMKLTTKR